MSATSETDSSFLCCHSASIFPNQSAGRCSVITISGRSRWCLQLYKDILLIQLEWKKQILTNSKLEPFFSYIISYLSFSFFLRCQEAKDSCFEMLNHCFEIQFLHINANGWQFVFHKMWSQNPKYSWNCKRSDQIFTKAAAFEQAKLIW